MALTEITSNDLLYDGGVNAFYYSASIATATAKEYYLNCSNFRSIYVGMYSLSGSSSKVSVYFPTQWAITTASQVADEWSEEAYVDEGGGAATVTDVYYYDGPLPRYLLFTWTAGNAIERGFHFIIRRRERDAVA